MTRKDQDKFSEIKARLRDIRARHPEAFDAKNPGFLRYSVEVVMEAEWLAAMLEQMDMALSRLLHREEEPELQTAEAQ